MRIFLSGAVIYGSGLLPVAGSCSTCFVPVRVNIKFTSGLPDAYSIGYGCLFVFGFVVLLSLIVSLSCPIVAQYATEKVSRSLAPTHHLCHADAVCWGRRLVGVPPDVRMRARIETLRA